MKNLSAANDQKRREYLSSLHSCLGTETFIALIIDELCKSHENVSVTLGRLKK